MSKKNSPRPESDLIDEGEAAGVGHNSLVGNKADLLKIVSELQALDDQAAVIREARADIMVVAKSKGFNSKHIREGLKLLKMEPEKREQFLEERDLYLHALGLV